MRYPHFLPKNGTIGFVAPSFGCQIEPYYSAFQNAQRKWTEKGYRLELGPNCYAGNGIGISNTPQKCAAEFMDYYCSDTNDCLISCGGGELMCEILEYLDFDALKKAAPKWFVGYSDNTNLTYLLTTVCDTAAVYGPCAAAYGMEPWHPSLEDCMGVLCGTVNGVHSYGKWEGESLKSEENPLAPYNVQNPLALKMFAGNKEIDAGQELLIQGRLIGGCMDCLVTLLGTKFDKTAEFIERYRDDGFIWFLEACDLNVFSIRRAMWQMEQAGWFQYVKGFLIGRPNSAYGQEMMGLDAYQAVLEVAGRKNVPVIMDADIGHLPPMMPIVSGSLAKVSAKDNTLSIQYRMQ